MKNKELYTISDVAKRFGLSAHALRYYDKEGLCPSLKKTSSGIRQFTEEDFKWLELLTCLKDTGMPIKEIKAYFQYCMQGDETIDVRFEMLQMQKQRIQDQMKLLRKHQIKIDQKIEYYQKAKAHLDTHKTP